VRLPALPLDLDPSGEQARRWVAEELARDDYYDGRSLLQRIMQWVQDLLQRLLGGGSAPGDAPGVPPIVTALVVVLVLGLLAALLTRIRPERHTAETAEAVLGELDLSATQFRDRGAAALRDGRWGDAVVEFTRAIAREAADRTLLAEAPSLTAHEVGAQLAPAFPAQAPRIAAAVDRFDAVRYGRYAAAEADARELADLDRLLRATHPVLDAAPPAPAPDRVGVAP